MVSRVFFTPLLGLACLAAGACASTHTSRPANIAQAIGARAGAAPRLDGAATPELPADVRLEDGLSREEAVAVALWNNAAFQVSASQLGFARADLVEAGLLSNPVLALLFPVGPKQFEGTLRWPIEVLWERPRRVAAARRSYESAAQGLVQFGLELAFAVRVAYADLALAIDRAALAAEASAALERIDALTQSRLQAGDVAQLDARAARVDVVRAGQEAERAAHDVTIARERLRLLLGLPAEDRALDRLQARTPLSLPAAAPAAGPAASGPKAAASAPASLSAPTTVSTSARAADGRASGAPNSPANERTNGPTTERTDRPATDRAKGPANHRTSGPVIDRAQGPTTERANEPASDRADDAEGEAAEAVAACGPPADYLKRALAARPDLRAAELAVEAAAARLGWERTRILSFTAVLDANGRGVDGFEAGPGIDASLPIFARNQGGRLRAQAELQRASAAYRALQQQIGLDVREASTLFTQAHESRAAWRDRIVTPLRANLADAEEAFASGESSYLFVLENSRRLIDARLRARELAADEQRALARIERATGAACHVSTGGLQ